MVQYGGQSGADVEWDEGMIKPNVYVTQACWFRHSTNRTMARFVKHSSQMAFS